MNTWIDDTRGRVTLLALALGTVLLLGLVAGYLADTPQAEVQPAYAAVCKAGNGPPCNFGLDGTKTSALEVEHMANAPEYVQPVEPTGGTRWSITAYWNTNVAPCREHSETAYATVSWGGTGWTVSNVTTTNNITAVSVCDTDTCSDVDVHGWGYMLIVDINDSITIKYRPYHLRKVDYATVTESDGRELDIENCSLGSSVSPAADSYSQTDTGPFTSANGRCPFDCTVSGPSVTITYD